MAAGAPLLPPLFGLSPAEVVALPELQGQPAFRARQVCRWLYVKREPDPLQMSDLPQPLREALAARPTRALPRIEDEAAGEDGTRKLLFRLHDGEAVEAVLMPGTEEGLTLCVSSQVGCALACAFCRTGGMGLRRDLLPEEMLAQVLDAGRLAAPLRVHRLVFMGMGEPLMNLPALLSTLDRLYGPTGMGFGPGRITVSTAGLPAAMAALRAHSAVQLAVSLGGSTEEQRKALMPVAHRLASLEQVLAACRALELGPQERITFEYVMVQGVNDSPQDARRLLAATRGLRCKFNLIPLNEHPSTALRRPSEERLRAFQQVLLDARRPTSLRYSKGRDLLAACGQLATTAPRRPAGDSQG